MMSGEQFNRFNPSSPSLIAVDWRSSLERAFLPLLSRVVATLNNDRPCGQPDFSSQTPTLLKVARPINALFCGRFPQRSHL